MSFNENSSDRSPRTNTSSLIPPTVIPKYFNVPFAIQHGYFRCIRYLLELAYDPNERDNQLRTPLLLCSYIENNRWSLSLAQNLLEKGAKIALEDHARRNAMHHACALQRIHLVQLYLSCLDFNLESKDSEGNTCLHYVAITGNCEIAELLIKTSEKLNIRLDQYVNREGCSAAVLALKYGHIECANQITHRDWDEFFVVPRPLSIYETPQSTLVNHSPSTITTMNTSIKKSKKPNPTMNSDIGPSTLSFGLLKIIFNEGDSSYSTRLAGLCNENKSHPTRRRLKQKKSDQSKSIPPRTTHYCSTEALVNEIQTESQLNTNQQESLNNLNRSSPRLRLLQQQSNLSSDEKLTSTLNYIQPTVSIFCEPSQTIKPKNQRPRTAHITRHQTSVNAIGYPSRLSSSKSSKFEKKSRPNSASFLVSSKNPHSNFTSETKTYSQTLYQGRPLSAILQNTHRHPPNQRTIDSSCVIREAKGATSRYNNPEELFGLKPEELFTMESHPQRMIHSHLQNSTTRFQQHIWKNDVDKLVDLYNIHHSSNYRRTANPPPSIFIQSDTTGDLLPTNKIRRMSISKNTSNISRVRSPTNPKQSTLASLNIARRNSIHQRPMMKLTNA